jgi:hypothetical protein
LIQNPVFFPPLLADTIPKPLMPLGVEQIKKPRQRLTANIPKPLMPLGVEHRRGTKGEQKANYS